MSSDDLTVEEIADIIEAEKEFKEGKCKVFKNVEEFLADLKK